MKILYRFIATLLVIAFSFTLITSDLSADQSARSNQGVSDFVTRLYDICFDRQPDEAGYTDWTNKLLNNEITGAEAAYGFIFSNEFQSLDVTNDQYVELMYNCFFGRSSDSAGKADWLSKMNNGLTRKDLFAGFANSVEFDELCATYGIMRGSYDPASNTFSLTANRASIEAFVTRLYDTFLNRLPDEAGLKDWVDQIAGGKITGSQAAYGFIFSAEYKALNKSDKDFVTDLYVGFLGRTPDQAGLNDWVAQIGSGKTDLDIFNGFAGSQEWIGLCREYGIEAGGAVTGESSARSGNTTPTTAPTTVPTTTPTIAPTTSPTQPSSGRYDPDNHGGYWIYGTLGTLPTQVQISTLQNADGSIKHRVVTIGNRQYDNGPIYKIIANATEFNSYNTSRCFYVCSSGYVIYYSQYSKMNWSQASDPMFGAQSQAPNYYCGNYWQQGCANDATAYLAAGIYGTSAATDAFDYDAHVSGKRIVGMYCNNNSQTWGYKKWDGDAVTNGGYTEIYNALLAYNRGARHSATILAKYGITNELRGDYLMIEWCEGNTSYNVYTLPLPDFYNYCAMGSDSAHTHFVTNVTIDPGNTFAMSRSWNHNSRSANVGFGDNRDLMTGETITLFYDLIKHEKVYGEDFTVDATGTIVYLNSDSDEWQF